MNDLGKIGDVLKIHGKEIRRELQSAVGASGIKKDSGKLQRGFAPKINRDNVGNYYGIGFSMPRYGFILNSGIDAGNIDDGRGGSYYTSGIKQHDFIGAALDKSMPRLAEDMGRVAGDLVVDTIKY